MKITAKQAETVVSYADGFERVHAETGALAMELKDALLDHNIEQCPGCLVWADAGEMIDDYGEPDGMCANCRRGQD
tara:strand:+ start:27715 stop:27942 length:228 start_codon:yes stop_codon:yes gene_type:complete